MTQGIMRTLKNPLQGLSDLANSLKAKLLSGMIERFALMEQNPVMANATFLDPRFKRSGFHDQNAADICVRRASYTK